LTQQLQVANSSTADVVEEANRSAADVVGKENT
jgi:hypothetical protein